MMKPEQELETVGALIKSVAASVLLALEAVRNTEDFNPDRIVERLLVQSLGAIYPDAKFFAEEFYKRDTSLALALEFDGEVFIIDPIDNTTVFLEGTSNEFAVMVAKLVGGKLVAGWMYYPKLEIMLSGHLELGAFINKFKLPPVSENDADLSSLVLGVMPNYSKSIKTISDAIDTVKPHFARVSERRAMCEQALDIMVSRKTDVLVNRVPWPWDTCAFFAIYMAWGGCISYADGSENNLHGIHNIGQIMAPNKAIMQRIISVSNSMWPALKDYSDKNSLKLQSWGAPASLKQ